MDIQHQYDATQGEFFIVDERQRKIAELSYFFVDAQTINATHTFVSEALRGQGWRINYIDHWPRLYGDIS